MKPSHYTTPRSLSECYFDPRGQAIFGNPVYNKSTNNATVYAYIGAVLLCIAAFIIII